MDLQELLGLWWTVPAGLALVGYACSLAGLTRPQRAKRPVRKPPKTKHPPLPLKAKKSHVRVVDGVVAVDVAAMPRPQGAKKRPRSRPILRRWWKRQSPKKRR